MEEETKVTNDEVDYIQAIQDLKNNSVPKEDYMKVVEEKKRLISALKDGKSIDNKEAQKIRSSDEIRKELFGSGKEYSNLQFIEKSLELRNALISEGKKDPFVPDIHGALPEQSTIQEAEKTAAILQECVDYAQGDSDVFTTELQRRTVDVNPMLLKNNFNRR